MELNRSSQVVKSLFLKRDLLLQGDKAHEKIRPTLLVCGGAMRGAYGAGVAIALHRLGLADCFDVVIGISTGAAIASYFLAGEEQTLLGTAIYYQECLNNFISFRRWPVVDIDYIERVMRAGPKKLDVAAVIRHRSQFFVGVTDWTAGKGSFIDVKKARPEPLLAIKASMAITALYRKPVAVNGQSFTDGSTSMSFPTKEVAERFDPTHMLVVANCSKNEKLLASCASNTEVLWGPDQIGRLTRDYDRLRIATKQGVLKTLAIFGEPNLPFTML